jgi:hypothetical protein
MSALTAQGKPETRTVDSQRYRYSATAADEQHERGLPVGERLNRQADAEELRRVADAQPSSRAATRLAPIGRAPCLARVVRRRAASTGRQTQPLSRPSSEELACRLCAQLRSARSASRDVLLALAECNRRAAGAVRPSRRAELGRTQQRDVGVADCRSARCGVRAARPRRLLVPAGTSVSKQRRPRQAPLLVMA